VDGIAALLLLFKHVVVVSAQALGIVVFEKEYPLTEVRSDVIDVACSYISTHTCTLSAPRFLGEPVPSDRLPNW
jgi:hypothetical protein